MVQSVCLDINVSEFYSASKVKGHGSCGHFGKFGHFGLQIGPLCLRNRTKNPWDYKTRAQELTSGAIGMFLSLFVWIWELFKDQMVWGSFYSVDFKGNFDSFYKFWYISALNEPIIEKLVTKIKNFWWSSCSWKKFWSIWPPKNSIGSQSWY